MHTVIVYIVCCIFLFAVFIPGSTLGGIDDVCSQDTLENNTYVSLCPKNSSVSACLPLRVQIYNRLQVMATNFPVAQQKEGSYLTGFSGGGLQCAPRLHAKHFSDATVQASG